MNWGSRALVTILASVALAACGGDDGGGSSTPTTQPPEGTTELKVTSKNIEFVETELTAPAGFITIFHDNQDRNLPHNIEIELGDSKPRTEIESGPVEQVVTFQAEPGTYTYVCVVHPNTMEGTLTVTAPKGDGKTSARPTTTTTTTVEPTD